MTTVDIKESIVNDKPQLTVTSDKYNGYFTVRKSNDGFSFFEISVSQGKVPKVLSGRYTGLRQAKQALVKYLESAKETKAKARDRKYEENHGPSTSTGSK